MIFDENSTLGTGIWWTRLLPIGISPKSGAGALQNALAPQPGGVERATGICSFPKGGVGSDTEHLRGLPCWGRDNDLLLFFPLMKQNPLYGASPGETL